ncbi:MAG: MobF family relaxase [Leptospirillum sp.]
MLSISARGSASGAEEYYKHLSEKDDYYQKGSEKKGVWMGSAAAVLGLSGEVGEADFKNLLRGRDLSGKDLVMGAGDEHRAGWDLTFSAPKSFSMLLNKARAEGNNELVKGLEKAWDDSVQKAIFLTEDLAGRSRRGKTGTAEAKLEPVGLVAAAFVHEGSRAGDGQHHTHVFTFNVGARPDGTFGTLESRDFYKYKMGLGAAQRAELASNLKEFAIAIERKGTLIEIVGVPDELCTDQSKRRQAIEKAAKEHGYKTAEGMEQATLRTRAVKENIPLSEIVSRVASDCEKHGYSVSDTLEASEDAEKIERTSDEAVIEKLMENRSVFWKQDIWKIVATESQGVTDIGGIRARVAEIESHAGIIKIVDSKTGAVAYTTPEMRDLESRTLEKALTRATERKHQISDHTLAQVFARYLTLTDEQKKAVVHLTQKSGGVAALEGWAGVGKSFSMAPVREAFESEGYQVLGAALGGKAARELENGSGIKSQTLHSLLSQIEDGRKEIDSKTVIVLDEAGMIGSRQIAAIINIAEERGAKVILAGDWKQLQAISSGVIFKDISGDLGHAEIKAIIRQTEAWAKEAVYNLAVGKTDDGIRAYRDRGFIHAGGSFFDAKKEAVSKFIEDPEKFADKALFARSRSDVKDLNDLVRGRRKEMGEIDNGFLFETDKGKREFSAGDRILFTKNDYRNLDVRNGDVGTVLSVSESSITVSLNSKLGASREITFRPADYDKIDHAYALTLHKGQGATFENAHGLLDEQWDRETTYVFFSRAKAGAHAYCDKVLGQELAERLQISHQKPTTLKFDRAKV